MKGLINGLVSIIAGGLLYAFYACTALVQKVNTAFGSTSDAMNVYDIIKTDSQYLPDTVKTYKIFAIIAMVIAGLLVVAGIISLLANLKVFKFKQANLVNVVVATLFLVIAIIVFIFGFVMASDCTTTFVKASSGFANYAVLVLGLAAFVGTLLTRKTK